MASHVHTGPGTEPCETPRIGFGFNSVLSHTLVELD